MGSTYGACGGCGGIPVPVPYPIGTGYIAPPVLAPPPIIATTRVLAPPVYSGVVDADPITPGIQSAPGVVTPVGPPRVAGGPGFIGGPGFVGGPRPFLGGPVGGASFVGGAPAYGYGGPSVIRPF